MSISRQVCAPWLLLAALTASGAETGPGPNLFTFDRMGAGVPAGWRLTGEKYEWTFNFALEPTAAAPSVLDG